MSDTPETDAAAMPWYGERDAVVGNFARSLERQRNFARSLERQRNDALQLARQLRDALELSQKSSTWEPVTQEEQKAADMAQAVIESALTNATLLLK